VRLRVLVRRVSTLAALGAALVAALVAAASGQPAAVRLSVDLPDTPSAGLRVFGQKRCIRCHSLTGAAAIGPDLTHVPVTGSALDLAGAFWNHAPAMRQKMDVLGVAPPEMNAGEMADLLALLTVYRPWAGDDSEPGRAAAGRQVFLTRGCAECHGTDGRRWGMLGPDLEKYRRSASGVFIAQGMWNHSSAMARALRQRNAPWPVISAREMGDLMAYLQSGSASSGVERVTFEAGSPRRGRELFAEKHCVSCHTVAGVGGRGGPELAFRPRAAAGSVTAIAASMWNHSQAMAAEFRRRGIGQPTFSGQEMADVIAYLRFVNYAHVRGDVSRGAQIFRTSCSSCHTAGGGPRVGPDLAAVPSLDTPVAIIASMWNHAAQMEEQARQRRLAWPRLERGDAADLAAFLLTRRSGR
jgi:mono/diheme cytochrome c family protein